MNKRVTTMVLAGLIGTLPAAHADAPALVHEGALTGPNQMTLYTFDKDAPGAGTSVCNGPCAEN